MHLVEIFIGSQIASNQPNMKTKIANQHTQPYNQDCIHTNDSRKRDKQMLKPIIF